MGTEVRRRMDERNLELATGYTATQEEYEGRGWTFAGSITVAAQQGFLTAKKCEQIGAPVGDAEWKKTRHFAMLADCHTDLCLTGEDGVRRRPCIPVFYRQRDESFPALRGATRRGANLPPKGQIHPETF